MAKAYTTTIDLLKLAKTYGALPAKVNKDIGLAYRKHRIEMMSRGLNLNDLSPMTPLKPATIKAKIRGSYSTTRAAGKTYKRKTGGKGESTLFTVLQNEGISFSSSVGNPRIPLIRTGNMVKGTNINAKDGLLEITQGVTRQQIQAYHQLGAGHNPVRVSLAWNQEFIEREMNPRIKLHYKTVIANARRAG